MAIVGYPFNFQMAAFSIVAKLTQRIYGTSNQAAAEDIFANRVMVRRMHTHITQISTKAQPI